MNCKELNQDIKRLKSLRDSLRKKVDAATETGLGRTAIELAKDNATNATDQVLEKYMDDFYEKNPELRRITLEKRIEGFTNVNGYPADTDSISPIPGTYNLLIGGGFGALHEYQKQPDGSYRLGERIERFVATNGKPTRTNSISPIPGTDNLLIGGGYGALYEYHKQPDSSYQLRERIEGFVAANGYTANVYSISPIPDTDNLLIGGDYGAFYEYQKQPDGSYQLGERIGGFVNAYGNPASVTSIAPIPGIDNLLIGGNYSTLYEYQKQPDGSYQLGERIEGFVDVDGKPAWANSISPIPGTDNLLIGGDDGALYECQKQPDGSYQLGERIEGFVDADGEPADVYSISPIPGTDNLLIGGNEGALYEAHINNPSLSNLKKALPQIVHNN